MTDLEIGWLAGIMDGEGCVQIQHIKTRKPEGKRARYECVRCNIVIGICHEPTVRKIQELTGYGTVIHNRKAKYNDKWNDVFIWQVSGISAWCFLTTIRKAIVTKLEEVDLAIEFLQLYAPRTGCKRLPEDIQNLRISYVDRMKALKPRNNPHGT